MANQKMLAASAMAALTAATLFTLPHARAAGQDGMVVVRDAQTGELRAPTAAEAAALHGGASAQRQASAPRVASVGPGGGRKVLLGKSALVYSVATRGADGQLQEQCVNGETAAHAALSHPNPVREPHHESE